MTTKINFVWVKKRLVFKDTSIYRHFSVFAAFCSDLVHPGLCLLHFAPLHVCNNSIFPRAASSSTLLIQTGGSSQTTDYIYIIRHEVTSQVCNFTYAAGFGYTVSDILRFEVFAQLCSRIYENINATIPHTHCENSKTATECEIFQVLW